LHPARAAIIIVRFVKGGEMGKINMGRVLIGGLVAGLVMNVIDGVVLANQWSEYMRNLGKEAAFSTNQIIGFNLIGFLMGILMIRLYAAIRPRYGAGPATAVRAGIAIWLIGNLLPNATYVIAGLAPANLTYIAMCVGVVEYVVAALVGAWLYKEEDALTARSAAA
jgi:hypothetical protein